jgi:hypothetical protein
MSYRRESDDRVAEFAGNLAQVLAGHKVNCFSDAESDALAAELGALSASFLAKIATSQTLTKQLRSANSEKRDDRMETDEKLGNVLAKLIAAQGSEADFDICGFSYRKKWTRVVAQQPDRLSVTDKGGGVNEIKYRGNNTPNSVNYEIHRRSGKNGEWALLTVVTKQSYVDTLDNPGTHYEYKVRAAASSNTSSFSGVGAVNTHMRLAKREDQS